MKKSDIAIMPEYFDRYIHLSDDVTYMEALEISLQELENAPLDKWIALDNQVYAKGKWTVKDILQHYIDVERVLVYRTLAIARGDQQKMLPFDEEDYAKNTHANNRTVLDLVAELKLVRQGTIAMYKYFTPEMILKIGNGFNGMKYGPLSLAFVIAGHQRWHIKVLEERYYPILENK